MYIEYVIGSYDDAYGQDVKYITKYGVANKREYAFKIYQDILKILTASNFDGSPESINLSNMYEIDESVFVEESNVPSFLSNVETDIDTIQNIDGKYKYGTAKIGGWWSLLKFNGAFNTVNNTIDTHLYFNFKYDVNKHFTSIVLTFKLLDKDKNGMPTDHSKSLLENKEDYVYVINLTSDIHSNTSTVNFHNFNLIFSLSDQHLYISAIKNTRKHDASSLNGTGLTYPIYTIVPKYQRGLILSKYTPYDHWFNTTNETYRNLIDGNLCSWVFSHAQGVLPQSPAKFPRPVLLNILNHKSKEIIPKSSTNNQCIVVWTSLMPITHATNMGSLNQGLQHIHKFANTDKKEVIWMGHLAFKSATTHTVNGDISQHSNIFYIHGTANNFTETVTDVRGITYKLFPWFYQNTSELSITTTDGSSDHASYPKIAIPMM